MSDDEREQCGGVRARASRPCAAVVEPMRCTVCHCSVEVCDGHHRRALDPNAPSYSESATCEGHNLRAALARITELEDAAIHAKPRVDERERIQAETVRAIVARLREVAFVRGSRPKPRGAATLAFEADRLERDWRAIVRGSR